MWVGVDDPLPKMKLTFTAGINTVTVTTAIQLQHVISPDSIHSANRAGMLCGKCEGNYSLK